MSPTHQGEREPLLGSSSAASTAPSTPSPDTKYLHDSQIHLADQQTLADDELLSKDPLLLPARQKWIILAGTSLASFLGAIDMTITAVLVAPIASSFHASHEAGLVATSFLLANIAFTPLYGRLTTILGRRLANATSIGLFALGTAMCAVAPSMKWLIAARFVAGAGGGGIMTTAQIVAADIFPLSQRGLVGALSTAVWAVGGALGGPLGGFVADKWGWRMAFTAQVPLLIIAMLSGLKYIDYSIKTDKKESFWAKVARIDILGSVLILLTFASLLSGISLKNNELLPWSDTRVIVSFALTPFFLALFILVEAYVAGEAILDFRLLKARVPLNCTILAFTVAVCNFGVMYSLPLHFLGVRGTSISEAGAHLIPSSVGMVLGSFAGGFIVHKTGKYRTGNILVGSLSTIAVLFISQLKADSGTIPSWLDILPMGAAFGFTLNTSFVALMAAIPHSDIPAMTGVLWLSRTAGQVMGVASTAGIFQSVLASALEKRITGPGADDIIRIIREDSNRIPEFAPEIVKAARQSYGQALQPVFYFCSAFAFLSWVAVSFVPQLDVKKGPPRAPPAQTDEEATA